MPLSGILRRVTDRRVHCQKCGEPLGYMSLFGPKKWEHIECPPYSPVRLATGV